MCHRGSDLEIYANRLRAQHEIFFDKKTRFIGYGNQVHVALHWAMMQRHLLQIAGYFDATIVRAFCPNKKNCINM